MYIVAVALAWPYAISKMQLMVPVVIYRITVIKYVFFIQDYK
jgi:hypothetical protein